jgi:hypothetical protein
MNDLYEDKEAKIKLQCISLLDTKCGELVEYLGAPACVCYPAVRRITSRNKLHTNLQCIKCEISITIASQEGVTDLYRRAEIVVINI